jgi:hypothetical protein
MPRRHDRYGWQSDLDIFSNSEPRVVRGKLQAFISDASKEQVRAWDDSIPWLQQECRELTARDVANGKYTAILEYELPRDSRRPDVVVLQRGSIVVLEIKGHLHASQAAVDQAFGYARDLGAYHAACAGKRVVPILVTRGAARDPIERDGVYVCRPESVDVLIEALSEQDQDLVSAEAFLADDAYAPLPSIVQAARELFHNRPLPFIKRARASTESALQYVTDVAHQAARGKSRHLVLLSGVPGSGKTLVGLQVVHAHWLDDLAVARNGVRPTTPAVYLSGNGPLVAVLQHALREAGGGGRTFVQGIKQYVEHYASRLTPPPEHLVVFDEAQRAHDAERFAHVHDEDVSESEPQHLIAFCERIPEWCVLVALIGDGQAIHQGEEGGIALWADALRSSALANAWTVHGARRLLDIFKANSLRTSETDRLNLDTEIRFHLTPRVHELVDGILEIATEDRLRSLADELHAHGHRYLLTRRLEHAKRYLMERYSDAKFARFGLLASSKDRWLPEFGVDNTWQTTKRLRVGPWYNADPSDPQSCCQLATVATEFSSQGLELDCALVAWGSDLLWNDGRWSIEYSRGTRGKVNNLLGLRKNVYRVLLTRGRDGTVVYVPTDARYDTTFARLRQVGFRILD